MSQVRFDPQKWASRSAAAGNEYAQGVQNPRRSWQSSATAAKDNYAAGINEAISDDRYSKGINKATDSKWKRGATEKGRGRYTQGVGVSQDNYRSGFAPFAAALQGLELGPRGPKGTNYDRVQKVGETLRQTKKTA